MYDGTDWIYVAENFLENRETSCLVRTLFRVVISLLC